MQAEFEEKLSRLAREKATDLALVIAPRLAKMPLPMLYVDDPFLPFSKAIIDATKDLVSAYIFDFAAYLALGAAGAVALERTMAYVKTEAVTILDGRFIDWGYAEVAMAFNADAITMHETFLIEKYLEEADIGVLLIRTGESGSHWSPIYKIDEGIVNIKGLRLQVLREDVLYQGRGEDFAEQVRAALEKMRDRR
jgi:hypothetical protein